MEFKLRFLGGWQSLLVYWGDWQNLHKVRLERNS
jgi:hypothetical protein